MSSRGDRNEIGTTTGAVTTDNNFTESPEFPKTASAVKTPSPIEPPSLAPIDWQPSPDPVVIAPPDPGKGSFE